MKIIRNSLAALSALLFVGTGLISLLLFNLDRKAFDPLTYQQAIANEQFYQRLPTIIAKALVASPQTGDLPRSMRGLSVETWEKFIRELLPPETLQSMGEGAISSVFAYVNGEQDQAGISLQPLKDSMAGQAGTRAVLDLMKTQPDCDREQIAQMAVAILNEDDLILCNPPEEALPLITPVLEAQLQFAAQTLPDQVSLVNPDPAGQQADARRGLRLLRALMRLSPLVPLGFLLATSLLAVRSLRGWLAWWGIPIAFTGLLATLVSLLGAPFVGLALLRFLVRNENGYLPAVFLDSASQLASAIVEELLKPTLLQGLVVFAVGALFVLAALLLKRGPDPDQQDESDWEAP